MNPLDALLRVSALGLLLVAAACTFDATSDEDGTGAQICTIDELEEMMEVCASYGGEFVGETTSTTGMSCVVGVQALDSLSDFSGVCAIEVSSECTVTCDFPDGVLGGDTG